jgi:hypothetical protein
MCEYALCGWPESDGDLIALCVGWIKRRSAPLTFRRTDSESPLGLYTRQTAQAAAKNIHTHVHETPHLPPVSLLSGTQRLPDKVVVPQKPAPVKKQVCSNLEDHGQEVDVMDSFERESHRGRAADRQK